MRAQRAVATYNRWPKWARIAAPVVGALVIIGAISGCGEDPKETAALSSATTTAPGGFTELEDPDIDAIATDAVHEAAIEGVTPAEMAAMIEKTCDAVDTSSVVPGLATTVARQAGNDDQVRDLVEAVGSGAEAYCPEQVAEDPSLLNTLYSSSVAANVTTTTAAPTTTATAPPPPTTAPPPPPTTAAPPPPPPPPPTTAAPRSAYYANCTEARNAGAAPVYRGDPGYGSHLDRDNDGVGCEN